MLLPARNRRHCERPAIFHTRIELVTYKLFRRLFCMVKVILRDLLCLANTEALLLCTLAFAF
jgi:hypothetical protein